MGDHCFNVILRSSGWIICEANYEIRKAYALREDAIEVARLLARFHWRNTGVPTAVRVTNTDSAEAWVDEIRYGSGTSDYGSTA